MKCIKVKRYEFSNKLVNQLPVTVNNQAKQRILIANFTTATAEIQCNAPFKALTFIGIDI